MTGAIIRGFMKDTLGVVLGRRRLQLMKRLLGVEWAEVSGVDAAKESERVVAYRREFCKGRRERDRIQGPARPVLGGTDESYVHSNHASRFSFGLSPTAWLETVRVDREAAVLEDRSAILALGDETGLVKDGKVLPLSLSRFLPYLSLS